MKMKKMATLFAILAATLYAINVPIVKSLIGNVGTTMMAGLLYFGAGIGMLIYVNIFKAFGGQRKKEPLTKKELPYTLAMIFLDILAPIFLILGIANTNSANVSLLNNFEIVVTSFVALIIFKEVISRRLWLAIMLVIVASIILSFEGFGAFTFNIGSIFVLCACVCWGFENNCTKMLSNKSSEDIVIIKGIFSGIGSIIVAFIIGESIPSLGFVLLIMVLGFVSYGLSINFYIMAQKDLGAAKTSAYYSIAPFLGVAFSIIILGERPMLRFYLACIIMVISTVMMVKDTIELQHTHEHEHIHSHEHSHGDIVHSHEHSHIHSHIHTHDFEAENHNHNHDILESHNHTHAIKEVLTTIR